MILPSGEAVALAKLSEPSDVYGKGGTSSQDCSAATAGAASVKLVSTTATAQAKAVRLMIGASQGRAKKTRVLPMDVRGGATTSLALLPTRTSSHVASGASISCPSRPAGPRAPASRRCLQNDEASINACTLSPALGHA